MCVCSIAFRNSRNNLPEFTDVQDTKRYGVLSDYVQKSLHSTIHYTAHRCKSNSSYWDSFFSKCQFQRRLYRLRPPGYSKKFMILSGESIPAVQKGRSTCQIDLSKCLCGFHAGRHYSGSPYLQFTRSGGASFLNYRRRIRYPAENRRNPMRSLKK